MKDFRSGDRKTSIAKRAPTTLMIAGSKAVSDTDIEDVARYFSSLKPRANYRVVEAAVVPKSTVLGWVNVVKESAETEPIGQRIEVENRMSARDASKCQSSQRITRAGIHVPVTSSTRPPVRSVAA